MPHTAPRRDSHWRRLLLALGASFLLFSAWSAYQAATGVSAVSDRDYYGQGLRYGESLAERRAAEDLGWHLAATLAGDTLALRLRDGAGRPVSGCMGEATLPDGPLPLREEAPGLYTARLATPLPGEVAARIELRRDGSTLSRRLLLSP